MFGEDESESPRTGSPWDSLISKSNPTSPVIEPARSPRVVPKLVPEVEEGNVEYKLRLLNPSTERFTRLVTQLKWRLLEGGGQAYYEIGVADSGQLVGLSRTHLEQSLQTLEEMAGEIGASVIVVKEIELPPALVEAVKNNGNSKGGKIADGATRMHKVRVSDYVETPPSTAGTDVESEQSTTEVEEEESCCVSSPVHLSHGISPHGRPGIAHTRTHRTSSNSYDSFLVEDCDSNGADIDLEIASVYKPRPHRRRTPTPQPTPPRVKRVSSSDSDDMSSIDLTSLHSPSSPVDVPHLQHRAMPRGCGKPKEMDLRRTLHAQIPRLVVDGSRTDYANGGTDSEPVSASPGIDTIGTREHLEVLDELEAAAALFSFHDNDNKNDDTFPEPRSGHRELQVESRQPMPIANESESVACADVMYHGVLTPEDPTERRYIVEALVVRKMSLEEAFLDFVNI